MAASDRNRARMRQHAEPRVCRGRGSPADVVVVVRRHSPDYPSRSVTATRHPGPTDAINPHPATVMKHDPAKWKVAHPYPVVFGVEAPMAV